MLEATADTRGAVKGRYLPFLAFHLEHAPGALLKLAGAGGLPTPAAITAGPFGFRILAGSFKAV